jgi:hypothetical protein
MKLALAPPRTVVIASLNWALSLAARSASFPTFQPYPTFRMGPIINIILFVFYLIIEFFEVKKKKNFIIIIIKIF